MTLPQIYTLHEAAERLRMKPNALGRLARRKGLCAINGRDLFFSDRDLIDIAKIMRVAARDGIRPAHVRLFMQRMMR